MAKKRRVKSKTKRKRSALRMLIVEARFYEDISDALMRGARAVLDDAGCEYSSITVPGALEIPATIAMALAAADYDGVVALGCVVRGDTYHFEVVANESARGLTYLSLGGIALGNGILTVDNEAQAKARAGTLSNKGADAARAAIHMAQLKRDLGSR